MVAHFLSYRKLQLEKSLFPYSNLPPRARLHYDLLSEHLFAACASSGLLRRNEAVLRSCANLILCYSNHDMWSALFAGRDVRPLVTSGTRAVLFATTHNLERPMKSDLSSCKSDRYNKRNEEDLAITPVTRHVATLICMRTELMRTALNPGFLQKEYETNPPRLCVSLEGYSFSDDVSLQTITHAKEEDSRRRQRFRR